MANLIPFTKRFESSENLVNLLESRGLQIYDRNKAIQYIDNIGYVTRNACGHHSRVWNKQNAIQPAIPNSPEREWITLPTDSMRAYFDLCIIKYFLNVISPNNDMQSKITWLFIRFPEIDLKALGFPQGWQMEPLWR